MRSGRGSARSRGGGLEKTADTAREQRASGLDAVGNDVLDNDRRGDGAEDDPECDHGDADGLLQIGQRGSGVNIFKAGIGHEIENALGDERGERPAQRPEQHADEIQEIAVAGMFQRGDGHETNEQAAKARSRDSG